MRRQVAFDDTRETAGVWVADGNSIMQGVFNSVGYDPPSLAVPMVHGNFTMYNAALGGAQIGGPSPSAPGAFQLTIPEVDVNTRPRVWANLKVVPTARWGTKTGARNVISCNGILNDILGGGQSAAQAIDRIKVYVKSKRTLFNRIVMCEEIAYNPDDVVANEKLTIVNEWHHSAEGRQYHDALAEFFTRIPQCRNAADPVYFQEAPHGVHPLDPLSTLMAVELARAINEANGL